ncbi:hypothetical protein [Actinoplanes sp. NPDC051851]|uniref:hypothetical protein n=1 Tax=Actinoplanes sp. NPDC051851 TaxID=3154753 RepID=UPI0034159147
MVRAAPGTVNRQELALAVLAALGKQLNTRPAEPAHRWWNLAQAWTVGHRIQHLVVDRAHTLPVELIRELRALAGAANATVWFVDAHPSGTVPALAGLPGAQTGNIDNLHEFARAGRSTAQPSDQRTRQVPAMTMPCAGFLTFRYACQRQLPADRVRQVDDAWLAAFGSAQSWLLRCYPYDETIRPAAAQIRAALPAISAALSARLAEQLYTAGNQATALLRLRATEAAVFRHGLLMRHQPRRAGGHEHLLRCPLTPVLAALINRTVSTNAAAAAALHLIYPIISADQRHLGEPRSWRVGNVDVDGSRLLTDYGAIPVPADAQPVLRAHLHTLHADRRAAPDAALIDQHRHSLTDLIEQVLAPLNLVASTSPPVYGIRGTYLYGHATAWMADRGLSLHSLADLTPPSDFPVALP